MREIISPIYEDILCAVSRCMPLKVLNPSTNINALTLNIALAIFIIILFHKVRWNIPGQMGVSKYLCYILRSWIIFMELKLWYPYPFHILRAYSFSFVVLVDSTHENGFQSHLSHQPSIDSWVSKWIKLHAYFWLCAEFLHQKVMSCLKIS